MTRLSLKQQEKLLVEVIQLLITIMEINHTIKIIQRIIQSIQLIQNSNRIGINMMFAIIKSVNEMVHDIVHHVILMVNQKLVILKSQKKQKNQKKIPWIRNLKNYNYN